MDDLMTRAQRYRDRAAILTQLARSEKNRALRASLVKAAKDYVHLCEKMVAKARAKKRPESSNCNSAAHGVVPATLLDLRMRLLAIFLFLHAGTIA